MELTNTHFQYLHAIYEASRTTPAVRSASVADRMHVSRPSVARMLGALANRKLIVKELYGKIHLTEEGFALARRFDRKVRLLAERFPRMGFALTEEEIYEAACAAASALPDKILDGSRGPSEHSVIRDDGAGRAG